MASVKKCNLSDPNSYDYLIEYRGNFLEEISKVDYACGYIITEKYGIVVVEGQRLQQLLKDVPSILFVRMRSIFVLEGSEVKELGNISQVKGNPYLNLNGSGVLIGFVDTGIDYLNKEFIREDGTSRVEAIWDQTIEEPLKPNDANSPAQSEVARETEGIKEIRIPFIGKYYSNSEINRAIDAKNQGQDPYTIVPSKDDIGHGTEIASIAGARGYDEAVQGVANDCNYVVVKLRESASFKKELQDNNLPEIPVYNNALIVAGIEFLKNYALSQNKPIVIVSSLGTPEHPHDGSDLFSRYVNEVASYRGVVFVSGTGNEGAAEGHASGIVKNIDSSVTKELNIPTEIKIFRFSVWIRKANKMAISIISPAGESTGVIEAKLNQVVTIQFVLDNTTVKINFSSPDLLTGLEIVNLEFTNIKPGIWKFIFIGRYIVDGRFDIWLPSNEVLPKGTRFIEPDSNETINAAGGAKNSVSVGYYNQENGASVAASGRGFPLDGKIKPDIAAPGVKIIATSIKERKVEVTGSSAAAAIVGGACALLVQWGIVDKNDITMFSIKIISYLIYGATREKGITYPNPSEGFGKLNLQGAFESIAGIIKSSTRSSDFLEYDMDNLYVRIPKDMVVKSDD